MFSRSWKFISAFTFIANFNPFRKNTIRFCNVNFFYQRGNKLVHRPENRNSVQQPLNTWCRKSQGVVRAYTHSLGPLSSSWFLIQLYLSSLLSEIPRGRQPILSNRLFRRNEIGQLISFSAQQPSDPNTYCFPLMFKFTLNCNRFLYIIQITFPGFLCPRYLVLLSTKRPRIVFPKLFVSTSLVFLFRVSPGSYRSANCVGRLSKERPRIIRFRYFPSVTRDSWVILSSAGGLPSFLTSWTIQFVWSY